MSQKRPTAKKLLPALLFSALAGITSQASAAQFSSVVVFGDSLSDAGIYRPGLTALLGPTAGAALGRFTTNPGPVWSELVTTYYGYTPAPSNANGNIFAQGGQRVSEPTPPSLMGPGGTQRPVSTQITEYLARSNGAADPNALFGVWVGANDLFVLAATPGQTAAQQQAFIQGTATSEIQQIGRLRAAGARYILVFGIPDIGATPQSLAGGAAAIAAGTAASAGYNLTLFTGLQSAGINVIPVDTFALLNEIRANPTPYGFTNITSPACLPVGSSSLTCLSNLAAAGAANSYLFADGVHPTSAAHRIVADYAISLIEGPQQLSLLAEAPLRSRESHLRTLEAGLAAVPGGERKLAPFVGIDGGKFELDATRINPRFDTEQKSITVGLAMRASESVVVGLGVGKSENEATLGGVGSFDTDETVLSAFASVKVNGFYLNGTLSVADVEYDSIRRNVQLGLVTRTASSSVDGSNSSGSVTAGYDFKFGKLSVGPFANFTAQNVTVNGFTEDGAGTANLKIGQQKRSSRVTSFGARASFDVGNFTPFIRVSAEREELNNERMIQATPAHLASGNTYFIPGYVGDNKWTTGTIGVRGVIGERLGLSVMYSSVSSRAGAKQDGVAASVVYQF
jgi:outer membrane lipase/esterase